MPAAGYWDPNYGTYTPGLGYTRGPDYKENRANRDAEFLAKWGYSPGQQKQAGQAQDAAEQEWQQLVGELQNRISEITGGAQARQLQSYYTGVMGGADAPYTPEVTSGLQSRATNPLFQGARNSIERLRASFAARGLGRSGGLGSMENRYLTDAATRAASESSRIGGEAVQANWGARQSGAQGLAGFYGSQQSMVNSLQQELARLRADRTYTTQQFGAGAPRTTPTTGGYGTTGYRPPPPQNTRRLGQTVPTYSFMGGQ